MNMKKDYIKPLVYVDLVEVRANFLDMSYGGDAGDNDPKFGDARQRYYSESTSNDKRGYGSNGGGNSGWGSLW